MLAALCSGWQELNATGVPSGSRFHASLWPMVHDIRTPAGHADGEGMHMTGLITKLNLTGLRAKFNLVILAAFAIGFVVAAIELNSVFKDNAREQVLQNARIMMTAANAIRSYTANELVPLLPMERDGKFVAETVPAYAAQQNFK